MNSLDSKSNDVKNKIGMSNDDSDDNSNDSNFSFVDKSNIRDNNLTLRLKGLDKRKKMKKLVSPRSYDIFSSSFSIGK